MIEFAKKYEELYKKYIFQELEMNDTKHSEAIKSFILKDKYLDRLNLWNDLKTSLNYTELSILANPYYIGFGNPMANVLFVGKELGFNPSDDINLMFHESIQNTFQWSNLDLESDKIQTKDLGFDPRIPTAYDYGKRFHYRDSWGRYEAVLRQLITEENMVLNESEVIKNSVFNNCFLTERNHLPSKWTSNLRSSTERARLLQEDFFKEFKYYIIAGDTYEDRDAVASTFGFNNPSTEILIEKYGVKRKTRLVADLYADSSRKLLYLRFHLTGSKPRSFISNIADYLKF